VAFFWLHIFGARWIYSGVPGVGAGGCSKNPKPAGRNSGATLCYAQLFVCIEDTLKIDFRALTVTHVTIVKNRETDPHRNTDTKSRLIVA
ncbi:MAG: hypothetical protein ACK50J_19485, partial [Planctomyces sp.]